MHFTSSLAASLSLKPSLILAIERDFDFLSLSISMFIETGLAKSEAVVVVARPDLVVAVVTSAQDSPGPPMRVQS